VRRAARTDANKLDIVSALRSIGCTVYDLKMPVDLLVGRAGCTLLLEIKRPPGPKGGMKDRDHTPAQKSFLASWNGGPVATVDSVDSALRAAGVLLPGRV
jgi:hypothetical protein